MKKREGNGMGIEIKEDKYIVREKKMNMKEGM